MSNYISVLFFFVTSELTEVYLAVIIKVEFLTTLLKFENFVSFFKCHYFTIYIYVCACVCVCVCVRARQQLYCN